MIKQSICHSLSQLREKIGEMKEITKFSGKYAFLSNFYIYPIHYMGYRFITAEHAYQWSKTLDKKIRYDILQADTAGKLLIVNLNL